jgi:hypothetical protein
VDPTADVNDGDDSDFYGEIDRQKLGEWIRAASAKMATLRTESVSELNNGSRIEANEANASRRPRPEWYKKAKPADRAKKRTARTKPRTTGTNAARSLGDSAEKGNAGSGLTIRAGPRTDNL